MPRLSLAKWYYTLIVGTSIRKSELCEWKDQSHTNFNSNHGSALLCATLGGSIWKQGTRGQGDNCACVKAHLFVFSGHRGSFTPTADVSHNVHLIHAPEVNRFLAPTAAQTLCPWEIPTGTSVLEAVVSLIKAEETQQSCYSKVPELQTQWHICHFVGLLRPAFFL